MPFAKRSTYTLTLAISAALVASQVSAETAPPEQEMAWSCSLSDDGEWDCSVNEDLVEQTESAEKAAQTAAPTQTQQEVIAQPSQTSSEPAQDTTAVEIESAPNATPAPIRKIQREAVVAAPAQETQKKVKANSSGVWDCVAGANGEWVCNDDQDAYAETISQPNQGSPTVAQPASRATQPHSGTWDCVADANGEWLCSDAVTKPQTPAIATTPSGTSTPATVAAVSSQPIAAPEVIGSEWQCDTTASGDWDCRKVNIHAVNVITARNTASAQAQYITENAYSYLDWAYYANRHGQQCAGRYLEPTFASHGDEHLDNPPLYLEANQSSTIIGGLTRLQGNVAIRQGKRRLNARSAELDQVTNKGRLEGDVRFREPGFLMLGDSAQIDTTNTETIVSNAQYVMHEDGLRGKAERIIRLEDERLRIEQGDYTYCPPFSDAWKLEADSIVLNQKEGYGEAKGTVLRVAGVPIFYTPYFTFPIDDSRKSGFLYPSIGHSEENGLDISVPYYFNIAPNMDDTLTARYMSDRGILFENEFRYLNQWSNNTLNTAYIYDDDLFGDDRWLLDVQHQGQPSDNWRTNIDFTSVSDDDYFEDLDTSLEVSRQDHLDQRGSISYVQRDWQINALVHDYQTIDRNSRSPYKRLPQITLSGTNEFADKGEFEYLAQYTKFDRDLEGLTGSNRIIGDRRHFLPSASYLWQKPWGYVKPEIALWSSSYSLENQVAGREENPSAHVPILSLDSTVIFERQLDNGGLQTLEPRIFGLYVPEENQDDIPDFDTSVTSFNYRSLFRNNRFSGKDRIGDTAQISLGIANRFFNASGNEKVSLSIGQAYYFSDRKVQLNRNTPTDTKGQSDIATEAIWNITPNFRASFNSILDSSSHNNNQSNLRLKYKSDLNRRFDFGYRYKDNSSEQTDLSFIWPIGSSWTTLGRWLYDVEERESLETAIGLEYESCCWKVSFAGRRWLDDNEEYDRGFVLNFTLKGLGAFGSGDNAFLNDIIGYEEREEHNEN